MHVNQCPGCGRPTKASVVRVNLNTNALYFFEHEVGLTPKEAELAFILARRAPEVVSYDHIFGQLWGDCEPETAMDNVKSLVPRLRRKVLAAGLGVSNYKERGYAMVVLPKMLRTERSTQGSIHASA